MANEEFLTKEGYKELEERLDYLKRVARVEVANKIEVARSFGDISENSEYDAAREEEALVAQEILDIEETLRNAKIINKLKIDTSTVGVGNTVVVDDLEYTLSLKEIQEKNLPTDMFGRILNTNKEAKGKRIKQYLMNATLDISVIELFTIIATIFGEDELSTVGLNLVKNATMNNILNFIISFLLGVVVFFIIEYIISEIKIRKYNKTSKK